MTPRDKFEAAEAALNAANKTYPAVAIEILKEAIKLIVDIRGDMFLVPDRNLHVILVTNLGEAYFKDKQPDNAKQEFLNALFLVETYQLDIYKKNILPIFNSLRAIPNKENSPAYDNICVVGLYALAENLFGIEHMVTSEELHEQYEAIKQMTTNYYIRNLSLQIYKILQFHFPIYFRQQLEKQLLSDEQTLPYEPPASIFYKQNKTNETSQLAQLRNEVAQLREEVARLAETQQVTPRASSPRFGFAGN